MSANLVVQNLFFHKDFGICNNGSTSGKLFYDLLNIFIKKTLPFSGLARLSTFCRLRTPSITASLTFETHCQIRVPVGSGERARAHGKGDFLRARQKSTR